MVKLWPFKRKKKPIEIRPSVNVGAPVGKRVGKVVDIHPSARTETKPGSR